MVDLNTSSPDETQSLGRLIGTWLPERSVLGIDGPLGVGKTCLVQGIALGLGLCSNVPVISPAYTLVQEYPIGERTIVHIDFYRLTSLAGSDRMLFEEIFENPRHVILIEWASKFLTELTSQFLSITISSEPETNLRTFTITSDSTHYSQLLRNISEYADTRS